MDELLRRLSANNFADIEGLQVTGTLPVRQDIVNDILTGVVRDMQAEPPAAPASSNNKPASADNKPAAADNINWWKLVNKLQVRMTEGKLILDFELRR